MSTNTAFKLPTDIVNDIKSKHGQDAVTSMLFKSPESIIILHDHFNKLRYSANNETKELLEANMNTLNQLLLQMVTVNAVVAGIPTKGNPSLISTYQKDINFESVKETEVTDTKEKQETKIVNLNATTVNDQVVYGPSTKQTEVIVSKEEIKKDEEEENSKVPALTSYYITGNPKTFNEAIAELKESYRINGTILYSVQVLLKNIMPTLFNVPIGQTGWLNNDNFTESTQAHHKLALSNVLVSAGLNPLDFIIDKKEGNLYIPTRIFNWEELVKVSSGWITKVGKKIDPDVKIESTITNGLTIDEIKKKALSRLIRCENKATIIKEFNIDLQSCVDYAYRNKQESIKLWKEVVTEFKGIEAEKEDIPEAEILSSELSTQKEEIVAKAEEKATKEVVESTIKEIIIKGNNDKSLNVMNEARKVFKKMQGYKLFGKETLNTLVNSWKQNINTSNETTADTSENKTEVATKLFKHIDIEKTREDIVESVNLCNKDITKFIELLMDMVFDKKMWIYAANTAVQYGNTFEELKEFSENDLHNWFNNHVKEANTYKNTEKVVEDKPEDVVVDKTEEVIKKYSYLQGQKNKNIIKKGINDFLLDSIIPDIHERKRILINNILKSTSLYRRSKEHEISNAINSVIKANTNLEALYA